MKRRSPSAVFALPLAVAIAGVAGLASGLIGDGGWDAASWIGLGVPVAIAALRWRGRSKV